MNNYGPGLGINQYQPRHQPPGDGRYLFDMQWTDYNGNPNLGFRVNDGLFSPLPDLCVMSSNWGISNRNPRYLSYVKIDFAMTRDEDGHLQDALGNLPPLPEDVPFELVRWLGAGSIYTGMVYTVSCGDENVPFDLEVCNAKTGELVQRIENIPSHEAAYSEGNVNIRHLVKCGQPLMVKLRFKKLPYQFDGMHSWYPKDFCGQPPCIGIVVHFLTEDTCHAPRILGCSANADHCCDMIPCEPCCQPVHYNPKKCDGCAEEQDPCPEVAC